MIQKCISRKLEFEVTDEDVLCSECCLALVY